MSIIVESLGKSFGEHQVLRNLNFSIEDGEFVSIWGRSGSGKTTLLYILSTLDFPTSGKRLLDGRDPQNMDSKSLHQLRNQEIGFIFQFHYLLPELTALENILLPARKRNLHMQYENRARELLNRFGLTDKVDRFPSQLSGGEQQRVAIARALIMKPKYIFADEPTGNLDTKNGEIVMHLLEEAQKTDRTTLVLVTHEPTYAKRAQRRIELVDGQLV